MGLNRIFNAPRKLIIGLSLLTLGFIFLINHLFGFFGHYGFDDMYYAAISQQVVTHTFSLGNDHYYYRWVLIFLTAIAYKLLGVNDTASAAMPLLITLLTAWLVARCIKNRWQAALAIFLFGLYSWTLFYADKIMPDVYVAFFFFAALYIVYKQIGAGGNYILSGVLFALSIILAFLSKETVILTLPIFFYLFTADLLQKRNVKFWITAIVSGSILLALYFVIIRVETGSFFQRYYAIQNGSYFNPCSYDLLPFSETLKRIETGLWFVFVRSGLFSLLIFSLAAISKRPLRDMLKVSSVDDFFPVVLVLGLLCSNFMSTSISHYVPMCEDPRHYLFLVPVAAIVASKGVFLFFETPKSFAWIPCLFFIAFWVAVKQYFENPYLTYLPLAIVTVIAFAVSFTRVNLLAVGVLAVLAISLAHPVQSFFYARSLGYRFQKKIVRNNIINRKDDIVVVTNLIEKCYGDYYLGFDSSHVVFRSFDEVKRQPVPPGKKIFLLLDGFSNTMAGKSWVDLPAYAKQTKSYRRIDSMGCAELFEIKPEDIK